jgi:glyoxylase-like metal-dependent hydrolase (beta-lactamase superfamily II)
LEHKQKIQFGSIELTVLFTPGHAPGHVVFYIEKEGIVINGDVLFKGSFGRTDLPGGDMETLKRSIHEVMFQLPNDTLVYCGHGPTTTIGVEKETNYILQF